MQSLRFQLARWWPHITRPGVFTLALLLGLAVYWVQLHASHERMQQQVVEDARQRSRQTAEALAEQVGTVVRSLDYFSQHLSWMWRQGNFAAFDDAAMIAMRTLPPGALAQVAFADTNGHVRYARLADDPKQLPSRPRVSIADREHFKVHAAADEPFLFISAPIKGRISNKWTIQFARGVWHNGEFRGVMLLAVSADYLAKAFKVIFPDSTDAASLIKSDGMYLARSYHLENVVGTTLPGTRPFMQHPDQDGGTYTAVAQVDNIERLYSWQRVDEFPLVILVGLGSEKVLAVTRKAIQDSRRQSGMGSALLLLSSLILAVLWAQGTRRSSDLQRAAEALRTSRAQLRVTLDAVRDGLWTYDHDNGLAQWDERIRAMLAYGDDHATPSTKTLVDLTHPADLQALQREGARLADNGDDEVINLHLRLRRGDGRWLWVQARGRVIERDGEGRPLQSVGTLTDISEQVAEANLRNALLDRSAVAILLVSPDRRMVNANARFASIFLKPGQALHELDFRDVHLDDEHWQRFSGVYDAIRDTGMQHFEYPFRDAEGRLRWFELHGVLQDREDPQSNVIWTWIDITDRHHASTALVVETLRLTTLLESFPGGVLIEDAADMVVFVNPLWAQLLDLPLSADQLKGLHDIELRKLLGPTVSGWLRSPRAERSIEARREHEVETATGRHLEIGHIEIRQNDAYLGSVWLVRDITARKKQELELAQLASTDALTALPNRRSFMRYLSELHAGALARHETTGVILMADIDHFKRVNDTYGHAVGDIVLQHIAGILVGAVRASDMAARLGGEEFAVLLPDTPLADARTIAERIRANVEACVIRANGHEVRITISLGLSGICAAHPAEVALQQADEALYQAKNAGRNRVSVWTGLES